MGERDLVLDGLAVDDVLRMMGAVGGAARTTESRERAPVQPDVPASAGAEKPGVAEGDWRKVLEQGKSKASAPQPAPMAPAEDVEVAAEPPTEAPAAPARVGRYEMPAAPAAKDAAPAHADAPEGIVVGTSERALFGGKLDAVASLDGIAEMVRACSACGLVKGTKNAVPGEGNPNADFVLVGEAPGQNEDETGRPFVGQAGQLLTKILEAIKLSREDVYICNVIKHRPPNNRNPLPDEITACSPFLRRQIELLRPKVIVALGTFAAQTLLETKTPIGKLRGQVHRYYGVPLVATYHPAALLRNPSWKRPTWEDVQLARRILDRATGA
jgi:DNA polymerase